jgi:hypothetical protein
MFWQYCPETFFWGSEYFWLQETKAGCVRLRQKGDHFCPQQLTSVTILSTSTKEK